MWAWGRMYLRISENTLKILSPDISSHGSVDRGCGIRGPHCSSPEFLDGLRGVPGTASFSKKENILRIRLSIYWLWLREVLLLGGTKLKNDASNVILLARLSVKQRTAVFPLDGQIQFHLISSGICFTARCLSLKNFI